MFHPAHPAVADPVRLLHSITPPQALDESGMAELAGEARRKLAQLQGDAPEEPVDAEYEPRASEEEEEEDEEEWAPRRRR